MMIRVGSPIYRGCLHTKSSINYHHHNNNNNNSSLSPSLKSFISVPSILTNKKHHHMSMVSAAAASSSSNGSSPSSSSSSLVNGYGIESMSKLFLDYGYTQREELSFPKKKLKAFWFSPPSSRSNSNGDTGSGIHGPLPRVFISELLVDQMSLEAQEIIHKYIGLSGAGHKHSALSSALGCLTWPKPSHSEFQKLARESEYAAWTLVNGYALNHVTISIHRLKSPLNNIDNLYHFIEDNGFKLNSEGGVCKVSPDGLLLQSSTVADSIPFEFSDGVKDSVPCSYIEFAQRLVLPQYKHLPEDKIEEVHRRDGFEVGNADKIFESTSKEQLTRKV